MRLEIPYDRNKTIAILRAQISLRKKGLLFMSILFSIILILVPILLIIKFTSDIMYYVLVILGLCYLAGILYAINKLGRNAYRKLKAIEHGLKMVESGYAYSLVIDGNAILIPYPLLETGYGPKMHELDGYYRINLDNEAKCLFVICLSGPIIRYKAFVIVRRLNDVTINPDYFIGPIERIADALVTNAVPVQVAWSFKHYKLIEYGAVMTGQKPDSIRKMEPYTTGKIYSNEDMPFKYLLPDKPSQALPKTP